MSIDSEYVVRIAKLEQKVSELYRHLGIAEPSGNEALSPEVMALLQQNNTIEAIKVHREQTGLDMAAAKAAIDEYLASGG
ncbi:MAG: hypothetical protein KDB52_07205 [Solirubrobacterales bacterium]|nr:hypothetical protein [Solirubrobacterales bacterium]